jgi:hypothetical protein
MSAGIWGDDLLMVGVIWVLGLGFRTLETEVFIVVVPVVDLLGFWTVGAMGGVLMACIV